MENQIKHTFPKKEKLVSKKLIDEVFLKGKSQKYTDFNVRYLIGNFDIPVSCQMLISVPKKNIRTAVKRNLIKRRVREAYRLNKHILINSLEKENKQLLIGIIFVGKQIPDFKQIEREIISVLNNFSTQFQG